MKKIKLYNLFLILFSIVIHAQVGINNSAPVETLDVVGDTSTKKLYLRNPGNPTQTGGYFLGGNANTLNRLNPNSTPMGIFNYLKLSLTNVSPSGVTDFDTKIDASKFVLVVHSFGLQSVTAAGVASTRITVDYNNDNINNKIQGSPVFQSFISGGTWHVRGFINNSTFKAVNPSGGISTDPHTYNIDFFMVAYYHIVTKDNIPSQSINVNGTDGSAQSLPVPAGF